MENSSTISERSQSESPIAAAAAATMQRLDRQMATILSKKFDPKTAFNYDLIEHLTNFLRLPKTTVERRKFQSIGRSLDAATILWGGKVSTLGVDVRKMRTTLSILHDARNDDEMAEEEEEEIINNIRRNRRPKRTGPASSSHRNNRIIVANIETINEKSPPNLDPPSMMMLTRNMGFCETLLPSQFLSATLHRNSRGLFLASDDDCVDDLGDQILDQKNFIDIAKFSCDKDFARCLRRFPAAVCPVRLFAQFEFRNRNRSAATENIVVDENTELPVLPLTTEIELISDGDEFHAFSFDIDAPIIDIPESDPIGGGLLDDGQNALTENRDDEAISPRRSIYQAQLEPIIAQDDNHLFNEEYLRKKFPRLYSQMLRRQCRFRRNRNSDKKATKRLRARDRLPNVYEASDEGGSNVWRRSARATTNSQSISLYPRNIARNWTIARHHMPHNGDVFPDFSELRNFFIAKNHQITEPNRPTEPKRRRQSLLQPRRSSRQPRISSPSENVAEDVPNDAIMMMMQQPQEEEEAAAEEAIDLNNNCIEPRRSFRLSFNLSRKSEFDDSAIMALEIEYAKTATRLDLRALKRTMTLFIDASISSNETGRASCELRDPTFGTGSSSPSRIRRNRSIKFDALHRHVMMQEQRRQRQKNGARIHCANAFVALLHLANEKKLKLCNENDDGGDDDDHHYNNYRINSIDDGAALSSANDYSNFSIFC